MRKLLGFVVMAVLVVGALMAYRGYQMVQAPNTKAEMQDTEIRLASGSTVTHLIDELEKHDILKSVSTFKQVAGWMDFEGSIPPGNYLLESGMSNRQIINRIRSGTQTPISLTINNVRMLTDAAGKIATQIEADSQDVYACLTSAKTIGTFGTDAANVLSYIIPNTYEIFWNSKPEEIVERLKREHAEFWNTGARSEKALSLGLSPEEVYTLASIVEKETLRRDEQAIVAGLYLNRLKIGMPLQADPTVVFATRQFDLRRVLLKHLAIDSPYNTYKHAGLPPGPIGMPSIHCIDAVLNADDHTYLYMCAKPESGGRHAFASDIKGHNANARVYRRWLDREGIR